MLNQHLKRHPQAFTLIEMLVTISILAILASILMPSLASAVESGHRNQINAQVKNLITLSDYRISGKRLGDWLFHTTPPSYSQEMDIALYYPTPWPEFISTSSLNNNNNWFGFLAKNQPQFKYMQNFDRLHPFNPVEGYFAFNGLSYPSQLVKEKGYNYFRLNEYRKIAFDVYDYHNEGDGQVSVGFADGHVAVEKTELRGLPDTKGVLFLTLSGSYTPGILKSDY